MKRKIFNFITAFLSKLSGRGIIDYKPSVYNAFGKTAVKSSLGFWYAGSVLERSDIAYGILNNGVAEKEGTALVQKILRHLLPGRDSLSFYDIGSNTGYFGILAAFMGKAKIFSYAFDPVSEHNAVEQETIYLNRLENNCKVFNMALGSSSGEVDIYIAGSGTSLYKNFVGDNYRQVRKVKKAMLDGFAKQENLPLPDFIKIDVEGAEAEVLEGAKAVIGASLPVIWYESARQIKKLGYNNPGYKRAGDILLGLGYGIYRQQDDKLFPLGKQDVPDGVSMYLALHGQKHSGIKKILELND